MAENTKEPEDMKMNAIDPIMLLQDINTELYMALNNGALVVGQKVDSIDREHVEKAAILVKALLLAQRTQ